MNKRPDVTDEDIGMRTFQIASSRSFFRRSKNGLARPRQTAEWTHLSQAVTALLAPLVAA